MLLAEDTPENREYVTLILRRMGLEVDCVANGLEVLQQLTERDYDLILMDVQMPLQDGLETTRLIRRGGTCPHVPIVALTAHALDGDRARCLAAGMDAYLTKSSTRADLTRAVEAWLPGKHRPQPGPAAVADPALSEAVEIWPPRELVGRFISAAQEHVRRLEAAARDHDAETVRAEAHALEGAAAVVRTTRLQRGARAVGHGAREGDWERVAAGISHLQAECTALRGMEVDGPRVAAGWPGDRRRLEAQGRE